MELLLCFKPEGLYSGNLEQRFGDMAAICADLLYLACTVCPRALCLL